MDNDDARKSAAYIHLFSFREQEPEYGEAHDLIFGWQWWCYECQGVIPWPFNYRCFICGSRNIANTADGDTWCEHHWSTWPELYEDIPVHMRQERPHSKRHRKYI